MRHLSHWVFQCLCTHPQKQTPPKSRRLQEQTHPQRGDTTPRADTPQEQTPPKSKHPRSRPPQEQTPPPGADPLKSRHPHKSRPPPPGADTPRADTPQDQTPPAPSPRADTPPLHTVNERPVRILLECILVRNLQASWYWSFS